MSHHADRALIRGVMRRLPKASIPADLVSAIESETIFKRSWWQSLSFRIRWLPAIVGVATAVGALWLSKFQQHPHPQPVIPVASRLQEPRVSHAFLPKTESSQHEKGESSEN